MAAKDWQGLHVACVVNTDAKATESFLSAIPCSALVSVCSDHQHSCLLHQARASVTTTHVSEGNCRDTRDGTITLRVWITVFGSVMDFTHQIHVVDIPSIHLLSACSVQDCVEPGAYPR